MTDSKVHGTNMGPIWGRQDPDGHHVGPMNFAIWAAIVIYNLTYIGYKCYDVLKNNKNNG